MRRAWDWTADHAVPVILIVGILMLGGAIGALAVHQARHERRERQREQHVFEASELAAEKLVIGSQVASCEGNAKKVVEDMNTWWEVDLADFRVADSSETSPAAAKIRRVEAEGIDREQKARATRVDFHDAPELHAPGWRAAAEKTHFACTAAFPLP